MPSERAGPGAGRKLEETSAEPPQRGSLARILSFGLVIGALVAALVIVFTRDNSPKSVSTLFSAAPDPGPIHVHGLGINPKDGALFIATHTGLWRTAPGESRAERVSDHQQDTMGFTIIGRDRFLGSGHPDQQQHREEGLPPLLGLIESTDGGESWQPISLLGEADFHVLRSNGSRIYGYDSTNERLMFSRDAGRTWTERRPPAPFLDMAVNPSNLSNLVASSQMGLWASTDEGRTWALRARAGRAGFLAWPRARTLYVVTVSGKVEKSSDEGRRWTAVGNAGGEPAALLAQTPRELYVALHDGTVKRSEDGGRTWAIRSSP